MPGHNEEVKLYSEVKLSRASGVHTTTRSLCVLFVRLGNRRRLCFGGTHVGHTPLSRATVHITCRSDTCKLFLTLNTCYCKDCHTTPGSRRGCSPCSGLCGLFPTPQTVCLWLSQSNLPYLRKPYQRGDELTSVSSLRPCRGLHTGNLFCISQAAVRFHSDSS